MANMPSAATLRRQIEAYLEKKIPSALTPVPKIRNAVYSTGIEPLDGLLQGGFPQGAVTEIVGPECSGRTSIALSFLASMTHQARVCAWIDVSNALDPESAAAIGVDLKRLLWLRCGAISETRQPVPYKFILPEKYLEPPVTKKGLHGGGFGSRPRQEIRGLSNAVGGLLKGEPLVRPQPEIREHPTQTAAAPSDLRKKSVRHSHAVPKPWSRMEQALRSADLLLQAGGFSGIVLDMGSLAAEFVSRVPLATWYRYRAAAERTQSSMVLLTQHACTKGSAELLIRVEPAEPLCDESTVFTGIKPLVSIVRQRYPQETSNVVPMHKPRTREDSATWTSRMSWADTR